VAAHVVAVSRSAAHTFSKPNEPSIRLIAGIGVEGDAHAGATVKHKSRVARDATQPNLRQVHLIHSELHDDLLDKGFAVRPGDIGENVTTRDVDLLGLPTGARLHLGETAVVEITGLRTPCQQNNVFLDGLLAQLIGRDDDGNVVRRSGVMAIVLAAGEVRSGDEIRVELPPLPHVPLEPV
jgi:MOSC domain-containing protein YiiM